MTDEEDVTAQLLRLAGAPPGPPIERAARVRHVVHGEWLAAQRRRMRRRRALTAVVVSGIAASLAIAVWMNLPGSVGAPPQEPILAAAERIQGTPQTRRQDERATKPRPLAVWMSIRAEDVIETDAASRVSVRMVDGSSVRIDRASRVRFVAPAVIELTAGALYVATADGSRGFEVRTAMGAVRDMGTRFEVRLSDSSLRLRVRAGTTEIRNGASVTAAAAGTEATVTTTGVTLRQVATHGSDWAWAAGLAPPFAIEGRSLRAYLERTSTEEGWTLHYANFEVDDAAGRIVLHGSVEGLAAEEGLDVVLATSGLTYRLSAGELVVSRPASAR